MVETIQELRMAVDEAREDLRESWDADEIDVHGSGYTLRWENEAEPVENVHEMVDELTALSNNAPEAEVQGRADDEGYYVSAWFCEGDEEV